VKADGSPEESPESYAKRVGEVLARDSGLQLSLDEVAHSLGDRASDVRFVAALLDFLEERGVRVESGESPALAPLLREVLTTARQARLHGEVARVSVIAEQLQVEPRLVRVALLYAEVLMRGRDARHPA
jgi:hypothetical protein